MNYSTKLLIVNKNIVVFLIVYILFKDGLDIHIIL